MTATAKRVRVFLSKTNSRPLKTFSAPESLGGSLGMHGNKAKKSNYPPAEPGALFL